MPSRRRERYLRDRRERRDYARGRGDYGSMDYRSDYRERDYRGDYRDYGYEPRAERYAMEFDKYKQPYARRAGVEAMDYRDYGYRDYRDYKEDDYDKEYEEDLHRWIEKLKKYDRFNMPKEQIIQKAKDMKVDFGEYDENEFYAIYLMHVSDYPQLANEPHTYLAMAKAWLEDKDLKIDPSEKVCKYMYEIAMADE